MNYKNIVRNGSYYYRGLVQGRIDGLFIGIPMGFGLLVGMIELGMSENYYHADINGDGIEDMMIERDLFGMSGPKLLYQGDVYGRYQKIEAPNSMQTEIMDQVVSRIYSSQNVETMSFD
jgi:hypothetical protein